MMKLQLLIVDDDVSLTRHLQSFFERQNYKVAVAHDGIQAVAMVGEFHPHLMFLDIGLPGQSGIEVLKQVKERDPAVRVIMITGQAEDELMRQCRILGADDYVTKPFTLEYLSGEVMNKLHKQLFHELRTASVELAIEREKAELLFDQVQQGVLLLDAQGLIFVANPAARATLGLPADLLTQTAQQIFRSFRSDPPDRLGRLDRETGQPFDIVRVEPKKLTLECRISSIISRNKERAGYLLLFRDVTEERKGETAKHHFVALISHKLRTPLVAIRAYPQILLGEKSIASLPDFAKNALRIIAKDCARMQRMVDQLIAFASLDPDQLLCQPIALLDLIKEAEKVIPLDIPVNSEQVQCEPGLDKMYVHVDPTFVQHAFSCIIENAFKFGARVVRVAGQTQNGSVVVTFKDDGPGIPPEDRQRIFERFYQVEKDFSGQVPGAGLGLTMVKQAVEAHGGRVWVESELGKGSSFFVKLPAAHVKREA